MIRRFALSFVVAAALPVFAPAFGQEMGGQITCQREAEQLLSYLDANRATLSPSQVQDAEKRLDVIGSQCRGQVQLGLTNLTVLRRDLEGQVQQQAQIPEER